MQPLSSSSPTPRTPRTPLKAPSSSPSGLRGSQSTQTRTPRKGSPAAVATPVADVATPRLEDGGRTAVKRGGGEEEEVDEDTDDGAARSPELRKRARPLMSPRRALFVAPGYVPAVPRAAASPVSAIAAGSAAVRRWQAAGAVAAGEPNVVRFTAEFDVEAVVGQGEFGVVYRCRNRLDGCRYAVKKSKQRVGPTTQAALREVYAHATLTRMGAHENVVRYYSVWREEDHIYIQNEYCDGGCLDVRHRYTETELRDILHQVAKGLAFIHEHKLVHLDVKPGNIFVAKADDGVIPDALKSNRASWNDRAISEPVLSTASAAGAPASGAASPPRLVYKVGDLGHVTSMENPRLQDGDSRYMAPELLNDDTSDLPRADVFSLGLSLYELARHVPLPKNGEEWQDLRKGLAPALPGYSDEFNHWLQIVERTSGPDELAGVLRALKEEKVKSASLQTQLEQTAAKEMKKDEADVSPSKRRMYRSHTTIF